MLSNEDFAAQKLAAQEHYLAEFFDDNDFMNVEPGSLVNTKVNIKWKLLISLIIGFKFDESFKIRTIYNLQLN